MNIRERILTYLKQFHMPQQCKIEKMERNIIASWGIFIFVIGIGIYEFLLFKAFPTQEHADHFPYALSLILLPVIFFLAGYICLKLEHKEKLWGKRIIFFISLISFNLLTLKNFITATSIVNGFSAWILVLILSLIIFTIHPLVYLLILVIDVIILLIFTDYLQQKLDYNIHMVLSAIQLLSIVRFKNIIAEYNSVHTLEDQIFNMKSKMIDIFGSIIENRDHLTGEHIVRTEQYVDMISRQLISDGLFKDELDEDKLRLIIPASSLHDIGKICISDVILNKPGIFTDEEYEIMKTHSQSGSRIIREDFSNMNMDEFAEYADQMALYHHERYDGTGYPLGLKGEDIPLCARIMAVADVLDALLSKRQYKEAFSREEALRIMKEGRGTQFDPVIIDALMELAEKGAI